MLAPIGLVLSNARLGAFNRKVRLISYLAYGFHSFDALTAMIYLRCAREQLLFLTEEPPPKQLEEPERYPDALRRVDDVGEETDASLRRRSRVERCATSYGCIAFLTSYGYA